MTGPCTGLTVLDFSWGMPGALTTLVLADFGAEVIKVEPPGGDPFRSHPGWLAWNRGKQGIVLDLETPEGREQAVRLAERADVLLESFRPGDTERLGIDYGALSQLHPRLVYCSITGFGQKGRLRRLKGYEGVVAAKSGKMLDLAGQPQREGPVYAAVQTASWAASQAAVRGILAALTMRDRFDRGQWVQTSLLQGMIPHEGGLHSRQLTRWDPVRFPPDPIPPNRRHSSLGYIPVRTKDGQWLQHANQRDRHIQGQIRAIGLGHLLDDERFKRVPDITPQNRDLLRVMILERMLEKTLDEWMDIYIKDENVAAEPYRHTLQGMQHPAFIHNRHVVEVQDPRVGPMKQLGLLVDMKDTPGEVGGPAPDLGQHTAAVLERLSPEATRLSESSRVMAPVAGASNGLDNGQKLPPPLEGIIILDLSTVIAGPYSGVLLADLGARVISVDATPERDERQRRAAAGGAGSMGNLRTYAGKEGIQVDLQTPEGREVVHQLIAQADVLVHNFRPGVPERLQMDYETCRKLNPRIVHVYMGTYGATGVHGPRPGAHPIPGALMGGALRQAGRGMPPSPDTPLTMEQIIEVTRWLMKSNWGPDQNTSSAIATGVMLGLRAREQSGVGQAVHVTMIGANGYANADEAYDYAGRPPHAVPDAECYGLHALYRLYQAKEGWVFLGCLFEEEWEAFCRTVGREALLTDPRFASAAARQAHDDELIAEIEGVFATRGAADWEELLTKADVACVQADGAGEGEFFEEDPHVRDNELVVEVEHPSIGSYLRHGGLVHFSLTPGRYGPAILVGQHTRSILHELGYSDEQADDFLERRVVDGVDVTPVPVG